MKFGASSAASKSRSGHSTKVNIGAMHGPEAATACTSLRLNCFWNPTSGTNPPTARELLRLREQARTGQQRDCAGRENSPEKWTPMFGPPNAEIKLGFQALRH